MSEVREFKDALLARSVISRYVGAKEFSTEEARKEYLHEHPGADPKNHTVKKQEERAPVKEEEGDDKGSKAADPGPVPAIPQKESKLFSKEEMNLPKSVTQKENDPTKLFAHAKEAHEQQLDWLNRGKGLDSKIGAKVVRGDKHEKVSDDDESEGPIIVIGPMKEMEKSSNKVKNDYDGKWEKLGDIVRASIALDSMDQLDNVMSLLRKQGLKVAKKPKDRFAEPGVDGYRDVMMNVTYPNGHIGELQLHLKPIIKAKKVGHKDYDITIKVGQKAKQEGRTELNPDEAKEFNQAMWRMRKLYDDAYAKAMSGGKGKNVTKEAFKSPGAPDLKKKAYFEFKGKPCVWDFPKLPVMTRSDGSTRVVYELGQFVQNASHIEESEYQKLVQEVTAKK